MADEYEIPRNYQQRLTRPFIEALFSYTTSGPMALLFDQTLGRDPRKTLLTMRRRYNLSRSHLAAILATTPSTLRRWETGQRKPNRTASKLIWLAYETVQRNPPNFALRYLASWGLTPLNFEPLTSADAASLEGIEVTETGGAGGCSRFGNLDNPEKTQHV
jgi:transcriptional regulator with XRE-family HTH domain